MITVNNLYINSNRDNLKLEATTDIGKVFTSIKIWDNNNYIINSNVTIITNGISTTNDITIDIPISMIKNKSLFYKGIYFVELTSNALVNNKTIAVVSNFKELDDCIINQLLQLNINDSSNMCKLIDCDITSLHVIYDGMIKAIINGYYKESINFYNILLKLCNINEKCNTCK